MRELFVIKKKWKECKLKVALFFPNLRKISYYSLGYQIVYRILNSIDGVLAERFTIDSPLSIESNRPVFDFDVIAISSNYEMNYPNIARFVKHSKFLENGKEVIIGGITTYNPGPLLKMSTKIGIGDAELLIPNLIHGADDGILFSESPKRTRALLCERINYEWQRYQVLPLSEDSRFLLECSRGCPHKCAFCLYGNVRRRIAIRDYEVLLEDLMFWREECPQISKFEVISSQPMVHPKIKKLLREGLELGFSYSLPSLRIESLDDEMLELIEKGGNKTITIAPENSERIRQRLGKHFSNEDLYLLAKRLKKFPGISSVKMYFMTGIMGEEEKDLEEIKTLIKKFKELSERKIKISINFLVPKPFTSQLSELSLKNLKKLNYKAKLIKKLFGIKISPKKAYVQGIFSLGGPEVGKVLLENPDIGTNFSLWKKVVERWGKDPLQDPWPYWEYIEL